MKNIIFIGVILTISNCANVYNEQKVQMENSEIGKNLVEEIPKIEAYVNYYGIVPCDYCVGIETNIYLTNFQTFVQKERFLYEKHQTLKVTHGTFNFDDNDKSLIHLSNGTTYKIHNKDCLQKLKDDGKLDDEPTLEQKQNAKSIYNIDINYHLKKHK